ncbi:IclR family transcriptional regulator [Lysinibacillus odysseyi 34hs-1 = NBRC 100172]|uniref:IclR family transcriptional regulator n=2 Tax=Lysinibacillus odysseyi TaxID=202611 RepID=A0A0A3IBA5_9BACI|nr:IclR family transcriptional regulator [Lysinibacillus odysseyi 34hs-1 = NBRC 100172]
MMNKNKTVVRSMDILNLFIDHTELSFHEIIKLSEIPKTSVYRMLQTLEEIGFIKKGADDNYRLDMLFLKFGHLVSNRLDVRKIAYPIMQGIHKDFKEAVILAIRDGKEAIYVEIINEKQKVRINTAIGHKSPLYVGACPRAIFSFLPEYEINVFLESVELESYAEGTITDMEKLFKRIKQERQQGFSISHSELENHISAVAAPIYNHLGEVVAAMGIAGFEANYQGGNIDIFVGELLKATIEISRQLGYEQP